MKTEHSILILRALYGPLLRPLIVRAVAETESKLDDSILFLLDVILGRPNLPEED